MRWAKLISLIVGISSAEEHIYGITCGTSSQSRIMYGEKADLKKIGYQVYFSALTSAGSMMCGGSIIGKKHILTAAHCTAGLILDGSWIITGNESMENNQFSEGQFYRILKVHDFPNYNEANFQNDISILELTTEIQFNEKVYPVCLPSSDFCLKNGRKLLVSGWGVTEQETTSDDLLQVEVELLSNCPWGEHEDVLKICAGSTKINENDECWR